MRKKHRRLLFYTVVASALVLVACQTKLVEQLPSLVHLKQPPPVDLQTALTERFGPIDQRLEVANGWVVLSPVKEGHREIAYLTGSSDTYQLVGQGHVVTATILGDPATATLTQAGDMLLVETKKDGAPQYAAYKVGSGGLESIDYYTAVAPEPTVKAGSFVVVNKELNALWHYEDGRLVKAYRVATGRDTDGPSPTWSDYATNFFTPEGTFQITNFLVNPAYTALKPGDKSYPGGVPGNPFGTRFMGFPVLGDGDAGGIWGIHGTSEPELIGTWASDGCIRMQVKDAEELFAALQGNAPTLQIVAR